jgi:hypothetical protein
MTSNVRQFPASPRMSQFLAEETCKSDIRQELGACVGLLHGNPTNADLLEVLARIKASVLLIDSMVAMREAHR